MYVFQLLFQPFRYMSTEDMWRGIYLLIYTLFVYLFMYLFIYLSANASMVIISVVQRSISKRSGWKGRWSHSTYTATPSNTTSKHSGLLILPDFCRFVFVQTAARSQRYHVRAVQLLDCAPFEVRGPYIPNLRILSHPAARALAIPWSKGHPYTTAARFAKLTL